MKKRVLVGIIFLFLPFTAFAAPSLDEVNQKVCNRFEEDAARLAAIMEELRERKGITETRVAFGGVDSQIEAADYWITYAAEAIAFQRSKKTDSQTTLKAQLNTLAGKVLRAKNEVKKALNE
ncbi:MAG: hypothetical protein AAB414_00115 [Patescibacteria group bacterium]